MRGIRDVDFNGFSFNFNLSAVDRGNYDLIFVNYNNGVDDIRRNARLAQEIIRWVNTQKAIFGSTEQNVVMGMSMGGLVARYGLAQMVRNGENTQVRLLITHDSPHRGANVPLGIQHLVRGVSKILPLRIFVRDLHIAARAIRSEAAKQMLLYRVDMDYISPIPIPGATVVDRNTWLDSDYRPMVDIATPYRIIATSQGSECGEGLISPGQELLDLKATGLAGLGYGFVKSGLKVKTKVWAGSADGSRNQVLDLQLFTEVRLFWDAVKIAVPFAGAWAKNEQGALPFDAMPGGVYPISQIENSNNQLIPGYWQVLSGSLNLYSELNARTTPGFCFVPLASALDVETFNRQTAFQRYSGGQSSNVRRLNSFSTQGEQFFDPITNSNIRNIQHISFTARQSHWLFNEMQNTPNNTLNCSVSCQPTNAYTASIDKNCSNATFTLNNPALNAPITWTANTGSPRSGTGSIATVSANIGEYVFVTYEIGVCNTHRYTTPAALIGLEANEARANRTASYGICPNGVDYYEYESSYTIEANNNNTASFYWQVVITDPLGAVVNQYTVQGRYHSVYFLNAGEEGTRVTSTAYYNGSCGWIALGSYVDIYTNTPCGNSGRVVSPNPASNELQIDNNGKSGTAILYNKYNQIVFQGNIEPLQKLQINTAKLPNDVYFLHIIEADGKSEQRQIVVSK